MWNKLPNGGIEREIKKHLKASGYDQGSYKLTDIELIAIERPGWKQIFEFQFSARTRAGEEVVTKGLAYDDHRSGSKILLCSNEEEFAEVLTAWSDGMILRRTSQHEFDPLLLLKFLGLILALVVGLAFLTHLQSG